MKSRTSFFNGPVFRKNLARFAPLWGGYTVCLLLGMLLMLDADGDSGYWFAARMAELCSAMAVINCGYALLTALVLFGDLYSSRMCNALHALPLRRECWFNTHVLSGLFFSLLPTAVMTGMALPLLWVMSAVERGWQIALYFLLTANLEYLFFFGLAVLCALCSGSRVGMAVLYGIANSLAYLAVFLTDTLITPMYYGAVTPKELFTLFCPVVQIVSSPLVVCQRHRVEAGLSVTGEELNNTYGTFHLGEGWVYLAVVAAIGVALLLLARAMYRRRRLECAGDFLSTGKLTPVFMVIFSLTVGILFQFIKTAFVGNDGMLPVFLYIGIAAGWFVGRMLLERQAKVFGRLKNWLGMAAMMAGVVAVLCFASLDPFGVEDWVPAVGDVEEVTMVNGHRGVVETDDPEEIADIVRIQELILGEKLTPEEADAQWKRAFDAALKTPEVLANQVHYTDMAEKLGYRKYISVDITYTLKSGRTVAREYCAWVDTEAAQHAKPYFNHVGAIFYHYNNIRTDEDLRNMVQRPHTIYVDNVILPEELLTEQLVADLVEAILADSRTGTMVQSDGYHEGLVLDKPGTLNHYYRVDIQFPQDSLYFNVYADSENCLQWMERYGIRKMADDRAIRDSQ